MFGVWCSSSVLYQNVCVGRERETILTILAGCFLNPLWAIGFPTMDPPGLTWLPLFFTAVEVTDWNQPGGQINLSIYDPEMWHCFLNAVVPSWFSLKGACVRARACVCVCGERDSYECVSVSLHVRLAETGVRCFMTAVPNCLFPRLTPCKQRWVNTFFWWQFYGKLLVLEYVSYLL